ncbi:AbrB/MazE/SpoVT family DNA-binding domain-containing protein [Mycoplasmatota bacterium]|nr:AbrB/MazE/SpoVT family DNA-binding domain-containing protein [Mycoplasmatota bacterium]
MKATGVVRRIDDLGRIVIPKEIRRTLRIREGDSLEIFVDQQGEVVFKKYSPVEDISSFAQQYVDAIQSSNKRDVLVVDREAVVAASGSIKKDVLEKKISDNLDELLTKRLSTTTKENEDFEICPDVFIKQPIALKPINSHGDIIGGVLVIGKKAISDIDISIIDTASTFIGKYLEN